MDHPRITVSVVIPAYRAEPTLPTVLEALAPQIGPGREVLLVQSGVEASSAVAFDTPSGRPWLRRIACEQQLLPGRARNLGAASARGELVVFLDADAIPYADWLDRLEQALRPGLDAVVGAILNGTPDSAVGTAEYMLTCAETFPGRPRPLRHGPSANLLIRRAAFEAVGGFDEQLRAGEDTVLTFPIASRGALGLAPHAAVLHVNRKQLKPFLANQRRQGAAFVAICERLPYPNRWVLRGPALALAGPLRLLALGRFLLHSPVQARQALRALPYLVVGTVAWVGGAREARR